MIKLDIQSNENNDLTYVSLWHVINGEWVHIFQTYSKDSGVEFYTAGKKEIAPDK